MSVEDLRKAVDEVKRLVEETLATTEAMTPHFDTALAGLASLLNSSAQMEAQAAQGTLREAAERMAEVRLAAHAATEAAAQYMTNL